MVAFPGSRPAAWQGSSPDRPGFLSGDDGGPGAVDACSGARGDRPVGAACVRYRLKLPLFLFGKQRSIAARGGGVDRHNLFERKTA
jgi:hypothetical protein